MSRLSHVRGKQGSRPPSPRQDHGSGSMGARSRALYEHMDVLDEIAHLLSEYGLPDGDVKRLIRGLEFDLDQMAVRDALGGKLSVAQKQFIRASILSGTRLIDIVSALKSSVPAH